MSAKKLTWCVRDIDR